LTTTQEPPADVQLARAVMHLARQFERYMDLEEFKYFADRGLKSVVADIARSEPARAAYDAALTARRPAPSATDDGGDR